MAQFHKLTVSEVKKETKDAISIAFDVPEHLRNELHYIQGQYLTLKVPINGEEFRRSYSVFSTPYLDEPIKVAVKRAVAHSQFALGSCLYVPHQLRQLCHLQYRRHIRR